MLEGSLRLVREFVNTYDMEEGKEVLRGPEDLGTWLRHNDLLPPGAPVTEADLPRAIALREAIRDLLTANHDGTPADKAALATLNATARRARLRPEFTAATVRLAPAATGTDAALGALLVIIAEAMTDGRWPRLKVCRNDACRWAFYDTSRSGAGKWCSMAICGNRNKAAAWRSRQRERRA